MNHFLPILIIVLSAYRIVFCDDECVTFHGRVVCKKKQFLAFFTSLTIKDLAYKDLILGRNFTNRKGFYVISGCVPETYYSKHADHKHEPYIEIYHICNSLVGETLIKRVPFKGRHEMTQLEDIVLDNNAPLWPGHKAYFSGFAS
ncbi:unnamed protein product [Soboliphyme baturini]|uniref:Transthyretin-like family protein n=1 Tax=Soboliphyme baturini TaxID=241478 RepID=A0A183INE5_9BILA|nr:unnamed protein product [Soboliphyme baturini]